MPIDQKRLKVRTSNLTSTSPWTVPTWHVKKFLKRGRGQGHVTPHSCEFTRRIYALSERLLVLFCHWLIWQINVYITHSQLSLLYIFISYKSPVHYRINYEVVQTWSETSLIALNELMKECAWVPLTGMLNSLPANTLLVLSNPTTHTKDENLRYIHNKETK